jgi:hypothetical protein
MALLLIPAAGLSAFLFVTTPPNPDTATTIPAYRTVGRSLALVGGPATIDAGGTTPGGGGTGSGVTSTSPTGSVNPTATEVTRDCTEALKTLDASKVFPIIPPELQVTGKCPSEYWNLDVARYFAYKGLTAINWFAGAAAILMTVYSGLLYMTGFANEANTKKAKAVLIATYVGLLITILARVILFGSLQLTQSGSLDSGKVQLDTSKTIK